MQASMMMPNPAASLAQSMRQSLAANTNRTEMARSCTDLVCLGAYLTIIVLTFGICGLTYRSGIPLYNRPRDFDHTPCLLPFAYLYTPTMDPSNSVCVQFCPLDSEVPMNCQPNSIYPTCPLSVQGLIRDQQFHLCYIMGSKISQPKPIRSIGRLIVQYKPAIIKAVLYTAAFALVLMILTLVMPDIMAYGTIMLLQVVLLALAGVCLYRYFSGAESFINTYMPFYFKSTRFLLVIAAAFFLAAVVSLMTICYRLAQIRFVVIMLKISRACVMANYLMFVVSATLASLCLGVFYLNIMCLDISLQLVNFNPINHSAHNQISQKPTGTALGVIWLIQFLWTHGVLISLSHFIFETWTTFWYYNSFMQHPGGFHNLISTLRLTLLHFGTIIFGACYPYYSQSLTNISNNLEVNCSNSPVLYNTACCFHNCCCRYLSVYSFIQTALKSFSFWPANIEMYNIRIMMSTDLRRVYMLGTYYANSGKYLVISVGAVICYFMLRWEPDIFTNLWNLAPLLIVASMLAAQVGTCFLDATGLVADTILLNYYMEFEYLRVNMLNMPMNTPPSALIWIQQALSMP